ncbi:hypothetical protein JTB14_032786 [Gonioctena quinquepunctata]|nr:hypothetical protein JTB14_032786 [Gonioctena quinquepunctata]
MTRNVNNLHGKQDDLDLNDHPRVPYPSMNDELNIDRENVNPKWYQEHKLDFNWLPEKYTYFQKYVEKVGARSRPFVTCDICKQYEHVAASKQSANRNYKEKSITSRQNHTLKQSKLN